MTQPEKTKSTMAGGVFIALGMLIGAIGGAYMGQPSAGMVIGFLSGVVIAVLVWAIDSKRNQGN
jgi:uncharacterized BrkB/YihY/UPF0761 family membrane protein